MVLTRKSKTIKKSLSKSISKSKSKTRKNTRKNKYMHPYVKHNYFIVDCKYDNLDLDNKYLEKHLQKLGLQPDNVMVDIEMENKKLARQHGISYKDFCNQKKKVNLPSIKQNIQADVFFYKIRTNMFLNKRFYKYEKFLLNILNLNYNQTIDKDVIYENIQKIDSELAQKYFIETFPINKFEKYNLPGNYILRPINSFGGVDILYINSKSELDNALAYYKKTKNYKGNIYGNNVVSSEFITNLLTFKEKKFHLRMYYIISVINGVVNSFLCKEGEIFTAKDKYDLNKPFTKEIHDTHGTSTDNDYFFPKDFTNDNLGINITTKQNNKINNEIYKKCKIMCSGITKALNKEHQKSSFLYPNQKNGYQIFGLDILIRDNLEPILIECNDSPGFRTNYSSNNDKLSKIIYGWINEVVLEPLFKYNDSYRIRKHNTYIHI